MDTYENEITIQLPSETQLSGEGYKHGIRDHPLFCWVCTNFNSAVAKELYGFNLERGLYLHDLYDGVTVHAEYGDIAEAAQNGCSSCLLLREILIAFKGPYVFEEVRTGEVTVTYLEGTTMVVTTADDDGNQIDSFELFTEPDKSCPWSTIGPLIHTINPYMSTPPWPGGIAKRVPRDPESDECYETIKGWMAHCQREHPWCDIESPWHERNRIIHSQAPKRLIYIGDAHSRLHLCELDKGQPTPTYLVLSYCWGSNANLVALHNNLEQLKTSIPFEQLAKTCQDAVDITRRLGFRYIWIDSLCILQDVEEDWEAESAMMGYIYMNAHLCIAATAAPSSDIGILQPRAATSTFSLVDIHGQSSLLYARRELTHTVFDWRTSDPTGNQFESSETARHRSPLFRRGWAFQERLLSLRILHYTESEMVWECLGSTSCECGAMDEYAGSVILQERRYITSIPRDVELRCNKLDRAKKLAKRFGHDRTEGYADTNANFIDSAMRRDYTLWLLLSGQDPRSEDIKKQAGDRWQNIVSEYSRRALTFATDTLPALSGLAARWSNMNVSDGHHVSYLAGLWKGNLERDLLWKYKDALDNGRPPDYLAPTWSWAANRRAVGWIKTFYGSDYHTRIVESQCRVTANVFGKVERGIIHLRGPALTGTVAISYNLRASSFALVKFGQGETENEYQFHVDSIPECATRDGQVVTVLWFCTDIQDIATQQGVDRALVLLKDAKSEQTYSRMGVMERLDANRLVGWRDLEVFIV